MYVKGAIKKLFETVQHIFHEINTKKKGYYVVISMLQEFVLKTILSHFYPHKQFRISIYECALADSKMQPFLVDLAFDSEANFENEGITLTLLNKTVLKLGSI